MFLDVARGVAELPPGVAQLPPGGRKYVLEFHLKSLIKIMLKLLPPGVAELPPGVADFYKILTET